MFRAWLIQVGKRLFGSRIRVQTFRRKPRSRPLELEALEDRCVPTNAVFTAQYGRQPTSNGGDVLTGNIPVYLIFAGGQGARYGFDGSVTRQDIINGVNNIFNSTYFSGLSEYGAATQAHLAGTHVSNVGLPTTFTVEGTDSDINNLVYFSIADNGGVFPEPDDTDRDGVYIVFTPTGYAISGGRAIGEHSDGHTGSWLDPDNADDAAITSSPVWVPSPIPTANQPANQVTRIRLSALDSMTCIFSHELAEMITDPDGGGVLATATNSFVQNYGGANERLGEIGDYEAQFYGAHENGTAVQSYWSARAGAYIVPDGTGRFIVGPIAGSGSMSAFERTLTSFQYTRDQTGVYALDNQANLWSNFGFEWQQVATKVRSFTLFFDTPIINYINDPPTPQTPYLDQAVTTTTPTFTWSAISGATSYSVSVIDAQTHLVVASASSLTGTSWTPSTPLTDGRGYQWQVTAYTPLNGSLIASKPSNSVYFFVNVSGALTLTSPAPDSTVTTSTPTLQWTPIPGAFTFKLSLYDVTTGIPVLNTPVGRSRPIPWP